jgi:hypothetical protein
MDRDSSLRGKCFDERRAEVPNIAGGGRCMVLARWPNRIAGELQLIADGHEIGRLQPRVRQLPSVQKGQGLQDRRQQLLHFLGIQGPVSQDLRERLVGIFHHYEQVVLSIGLPPAELEKLNQILMRQVGRRLPARQQRLRLRSIRPHQLDRGLGQVFCLMFGKEHRRVIRPPQASAQNETPLDDLVLACRPDVGGAGLSGFRAHLRCIRRRCGMDSSPHFAGERTLP